MNRLLLLVAIGIGMLAFGIAVELFTREICDWVKKIIGEKNGLLDLNSTLTLLSMRFSGAGAILMGLFFLWAALRALRQ